VLVKAEKKLNHIRGEYMAICFYLIGPI